MASESRKANSRSPPAIIMSTTGTQRVKSDQDESGGYKPRK